MKDYTEWFCLIACGLTAIDTAISGHSWEPFLAAWYVIIAIMYHDKG